MQEPKKAYVAGASGVLVSRFFSIVAGVLSLWFLARILNTEDFASYAVAMSVLVLVSYGAGLGIERALILRISELPPQNKTLVGRSLMLKTATIVAVLSVLAAILVSVLAHHMTPNQPSNTSEWIKRMSPIVPATAVSLVLISWFQANHKVGVSELMQGLNDGARSIVFGVAFAAGLGASAVVTGAVAAAFLPIIVLVFLTLGRSQPLPASLGRRDVLAGFQFLVMRMSTMGLRQLDIVGMGLFSTSIETAQYAVATRVAAITTIGQGAFINTYAPRVRRHLALGDRAAIAREYHTTRVLAFSLTLAAAFGFFLFGTFALGFFGDFKAAFAPLLILIAGHLVNAGFGAHNMHLSMSGDLALSMMNRVFSLVIFLLLLILLVPPFGGVGAAFAFLIATTIHGLGGAAILRFRAGPAAITPLFATATILSTLALISAALFDFLWPVGATAIAMTCAILLIGERQIFRATLTDILSLRQ